MFSFFGKTITNRDKIEKIPHPVALVILDGFGISPISEGNAVWHAKTPNLDYLAKYFVKTLLHSSGNEVGLPYGEFGNSEVGHLNIGAGRVVYQPLLRVSRAIEHGALEENSVTNDILHHLKKTKGNLHLLGLISAGGVHSHIEHLLYLLEWAEKAKIKKIFLHLFTDGRDSQPNVAENFIFDIEKKIKELKIDAQIASIGGRYFGMDRDKIWERTELAYKSIIGTSNNKTQNIREVIASAYAKGKTDEFIEPTTVIDKNKKPITGITDGDALLCFNFRPDRMRQIVATFADRRFRGFKVKKIKKLFIASMTEYDPTLGLPVIFPENNIKNPLAEVLAKHGLKQLHIAETQKYPHVTYFFNGGQEKPYPNESRIIIPSLKVGNFDEAPHMSAESIAKKVLGSLEKNEQDFYVINFANPDMVGHTGDFSATCRGIEKVDDLLGKIAKKIIDLGGSVIITSDHGNSEEMINFETGEVDTEHNIYPVPLILAHRDLKKTKASPTFRELIMEPTGTLSDVAPTILDLLNIKKPAEMTGISLLNTMR
ncbi:2,3-bisphosphoglycerate-independent phosphoglycerate mutase [Candidatus Microgenomates bacterium]|nr:2,3-bisphosphoglycerate-independent phosphoglycerate mutase [Candidatus Microgenomates bacterium]